MDSSYDDLHFIVKNSTETFSVIFKHCVNRLVMYWKASPPVRVIIIYCSTLFSSTEEANKSRNLFYGQKRKSFWNSYLTHSALHTHTKLSVGPFVKAGWKKIYPGYLSSFILQKAIWPSFLVFYIIFRFIFRRDYFSGHCVWKS